jgi:pimeloyl-ACP methyl ester carboxylesterase
MHETVGLQVSKALFRWDALEVEKALAAVQVPMLAVQTTVDSPDGQRRSLKPGERTPWLDLLSLHLDRRPLEVAIISAAGHFAMLEHPAEVNRLLDGFLFA